MHFFSLPGPCSPKARWRGQWGKRSWGQEISLKEQLFPAPGWEGLVHEEVGTWDRAPGLTLPLPADPTHPTPATIRATSLPLPELHRRTGHLTASGALCWAERGRRAGLRGLWLLWLWACQLPPLLFPHESQGKGCILVHRFLSRLCTGLQLSPHARTSRSQPQPLALQANVLALQ